MAKLFAQVVGGFFSGVFAGFIGYATDIATSAIFGAFKPFSPMIGVLGFVYGIISFFSGIEDAILAGAFFSLGIIVAGFWLNDFVTVISGIISVVGLAIGVGKRGSFY